MPTRLTRRSIVFNGDLGSGKSTVSVLLAERLGIRRISVGDLYRTMAAERGMTALQLNLHAELDEQQLDDYVDQLQSDIAASAEQLIIDSRLAWYFFTDAVKIHFIAEPSVAARRVLGRPGDTVENYASIEEARGRLAARSESERMRFISRYGADKTRLRNYDLVCDSTSATPEQIVEQIIAYLGSGSRLRPTRLLDPNRIYLPAEGDDGIPAVGVGYVAPRFFAVSGHRAVRAAVRAGEPLVAATLVAEANSADSAGGSDRAGEEIAGRPIRDWAASHGVPLPPPTQS